MDSGEHERAVEHLQDALETEDSDTKNYHIRQALQFLGLHDSGE